MKFVFHNSTTSKARFAFIFCYLLCGIPMLAQTKLAQDKVTQTKLAQNMAGSKDSILDNRVGFTSLFKFSATGKKDKPFTFELNSKAVGFIQSYMDKQGPELKKMKTWGKPYFALYDEILLANGIPVALKYLSVIESHLSSNLTSWAGAVGPWQLMPDEAARLGLKTSPIDERTDFKKSTQAAATIIKELYTQFGDWLLVVAAYNGGAGRVSNALKKKGTHDFWQIEYDLPLETRNHVKKFIATYYIFEEENASAFDAGGKVNAFDAGVPIKRGTNVKQNKELVQNDDQGMVSVEVSGRFLLSAIAKNIAVDIKLLEGANPQFNQTVAAGKIYHLKLPKDKLEIFEAHKNEILQASLQMLYTIKE